MPDSGDVLNFFMSLLYHLILSVVRQYFYKYVKMLYNVNEWQKKKRLALERNFGRLFLS